MGKTGTNYTCMNGASLHKGIRQPDWKPEAVFNSAAPDSAHPTPVSAVQRPAGTQMKRPRCKTQPAWEPFLRDLAHNHIPTGGLQSSRPRRQTRPGKLRHSFYAVSMGRRLNRL
jgi:hypothetical protein